MLGTEKKHIFLVHVIAFSSPRMHRRYGSPPELCIHTLLGFNFTKTLMCQEVLETLALQCLTVIVGLFLYFLFRHYLFSWYSIFIPRNLMVMNLLVRFVYTKSGQQKPNSQTIVHKNFPPSWDFSIFLGVVLGVLLNYLEDIPFSHIQGTYLYKWMIGWGHWPLVSRLLPKGNIFIPSCSGRYFPTFWFGGWIRILHLHGLSLGAFFLKTNRGVMISCCKKHLQIGTFTGLLESFQSNTSTYSLRNKRENREVS